MTTEERKAEDARFRQEYPLFAQYPELIYLDNAATTQKPSCVIQSESAFYEKYNANHSVVFMSWPSLLQSIMRRLEQLLQSFFMQIQMRLFLPEMHQRV